MKKIVLVGCGRISKRHIDAIQNTDGVEIALVCDINEQRAEETGKLLAVPYLTEFTIIGEKGTIRLSGTNLNTIDFWDVEGMEKPDMDFTLDHQYAKGHNNMYEYIAAERWDMFPSRKDILSEIAVMEKLSY